MVRPGVLDADLRARGARVAARLELVDERTFSGSGTIDLGHGDAIRFRSLGHGTLEPAGDGRHRHGTSILGVVEGLGRYAGARGRITSNFVLSPDGVLEDEQVVVLFIEQEEEQ